MATCRDVITRAFRKVRIYGAGEEPSAEDMADGLEELQALYDQMAVNGMFGALTDVLTDGEYDAEPFERVRITGVEEVNLPDDIDDGEFPPFDLSLIEVVRDGEEIERHLYDRGTWVEISALTLDSNAPLASRGMSGLAACLAMSLAEEYGKAVGPLVVRQAASFKTGLALRLGGDAQRTAPDYY